MTATLFDAATLGRLRLRNRVAMAPMTRSRATDDGLPTPLMTLYYTQRSEAGLIVSEGAQISPQAQGFLNTPGLFNDAQVAGWREIADAVHAQGSRIFVQLWHVGRIAHPDNMAGGLQPVAPSAIAHERTVVTRTGPQPVPVPRALTVAEIRQTIADYAHAARRAVEAGCDGIEIHAANGYLPSQFLHRTSNLRDDAYGGSVANRIRFLVEAAEACAQAIGSDRVAVRLTPFSAFNGATSDDEAELYDALLPALAELELGYLHVVGAEVSGNQTVQRAEGEVLPDVLAFVRPRWPHVLMAAGSYDLERANEALQQNRADLIAFGRDFIANPDLVTRLRDRVPLAPRNPAEWYGPAAEGYTDYLPWSAQHRQGMETSS